MSRRRSLPRHRKNDSIAGIMPLLQYQGCRFNPARGDEARRIGYLVAIADCCKAVDLARRTCAAARLPPDYVDEQKRATDVILDEAVELGDPRHWTDLTERSCLRLLSRASTLAMRCALHVWSGCTAGDVAAEEAGTARYCRHWRCTTRPRSSGP